MYIYNLYIFFLTQHFCGPTFNFTFFYMKQPYNDLSYIEVPV